MKDTFYFSHDYNTRQDVKIKKLIQKHGMCGYGIFWAIVEDLYNNANALPLDYDSIAFDLRMDLDIIKSVINDFDFFIIEDNEFGSKSVQKRLEERNEKSTKARESAFKRWNKKETDANALPSQSEPNAIKEIKEMKEKENKINKIDSIFSFSDFWNLYPNKIAKSKCKEKYYKLSVEDIKQIKNTLDDFIKFKPFATYNHPNPETYLNQKRWDDEIKEKIEKQNETKFFTFYNHLLGKDVKEPIPEGLILKHGYKYAYDYSRKIVCQIPA